jgi:phosphoglycolate phosphatase
LGTDPLTPKKEILMNLSDRLDKSLHGKEHIIWDWNGTLLSDVEHAVQTVNSLLDDHKLPRIDIHQYRKLFEFPVLNYYKALGFNFEKESFENLCHRFVEKFMSGFRDLPLIPEMKTVLMNLHNKELKQSVLSATDQSNLDAMISHFELNHVFKFVYGINNKFAGSKVERGHELIQVSNIDLKKTIIIGDTLHDLDVAKALGIDAILISHGHQCPTRLKPHHDKVIVVDI